MCAQRGKIFTLFFSRSGSAFIAFQLSRKTQAKPCLGQCLFPAEDSDSYMQTVQVAAKTPKGTFWFWASPKGHISSPKGHCALWYRPSENTGSMPLCMRNCMASLHAQRTWNTQCICRKISDALATQIATGATCMSTL